MSLFFSKRNGEFARQGGTPRRKRPVASTASLDGRLAYTDTYYRHYPFTHISVTEAYTGTYQPVDVYSSCFLGRGFGTLGFFAGCAEGVVFGFFILRQIEPHALFLLFFFFFSRGGDGGASKRDLGCSECAEPQEKREGYGPCVSKIIWSSNLW